MTDTIPVFAPHIHIDTIKHIVDAFNVGWLGMGEFTKEFEEQISRYLNLNTRYVVDRYVTDRYAVATNTGTSALHMALLAAGVGPGDEVITPSFNYVADHQAISATGASVVMCDIKEDNLGVDCSKLEELITDKTKVILPLHFAGIPFDIKEVYELAKKYNLRVVEDCCHAFGSTVDNKKIGSFGDISCFSFDPVKIITSIDGGAVVVNSQDELSQLHLLRFLGVNKETSERYKNKRAWEYDVLCQGFRYHMTNINAAVGISQIKRVDEFISSRRKVCRLYNESFKDISGVIIPHTNFDNVSPFIYSLRVLDNKRESLIKYLYERKIDVGIHFIPVHKHSYYSKAITGDMSITDEVVKQVVTLPLHSNMKPEYVDRVIKGVTGFFEL